MSFAILRCNKCGRIIYYPHCAHRRVDCTNKGCNNKIWIEKESMVDIQFGTDFQPIANTAYIFINAFNNYAHLAARVYSQDGGNFLVIPISERNIGELTRKDTLASIPEGVKHSTAWDGLIIKSGCYPVSPEMEVEIKKGLYVRERDNV